MSHWQSKTKIDGADRLFSEYIRKRDGNRCKYCGADGRLAQLDNSHFWGRAKESTRFDDENCDAFCRPCHGRLEGEKGVDRYKHNGVDVERPRLYRLWKIKQLGPERFAALEVRAHSYKKKDRKLSLLIVKALMRELETENVVGRRA